MDAVVEEADEEELALRGELLDDRLDHEVAVGEVAEVGRRLEASERGVALVLRALGLFPPFA
jgi:hypothetical protein